MKLCVSSALAPMMRSAIHRVDPDATIVELNPDGTFVGDPDGVDVFCFSVDLSQTDDALGAAWGLLSADSLAWVQAPGAGVEMPIWSELLDRGVRVSSAAGVHAEPVAQYVMTYVLHWHRQVEAHRLAQAERQWVPIVSDDLTTKTLGIVGLGGIGLAAARMAKGFGMRVVGLRRSPIDDPNVDRVVGPDQLDEVIAESDYLVLAVPLTAVTRNLIGAAQLAAMRHDAVLINVARGPVVDHAALEHALRAGEIRGAVLDVTEPEPLLSSSPLWGLDNCILTPHDAGYSPLAGERLGELFLRNFEAFVTGAPLQNEVRSAG